MHPSCSIGPSILERIHCFISSHADFRGRERVSVDDIQRLHNHKRGPKRRKESRKYKDHDKDIYRQQKCGNRQHCQVAGWLGGDGCAGEF